MKPSHMWLTDTAGGSSAVYTHTSCFTPRHAHPASVRFLTVVQYVLATHETAGSSVLLRAAHSNVLND